MSTIAMAGGTQMRGNRGARRFRQCLLGLVVAALFTGQSAAHAAVLGAPVVKPVPEAPLEMLQIGALAVLALLFHWRRRSGKS